MLLQAPTLLEEPQEMAESLTAEQAKGKDIAAMGEGLGRTYHALWQEVAWLHSYWGEYVDLFGEKESRIKLLNRAAPRFFRVVQDALWHQTILHIARLTDPPHSGAASRKNLTIRALPDLITNDELRARVSELIAKALDAGKFCRDWRNRYLAHHDYNLAMGVAPPLEPANRRKVKDALNATASVLNAVSAHFLDSETSFSSIISVGGAEELLYVLDDGLRAEEERRDRMRRRQMRPEDLEARDL